MKYITGKIKVRYNETDQMGIVHHSNYLKFFELARIEWLEKLNMPYEEIERNNIILPVVRCELKFIKPLLMVKSLKGTGENPAIASKVIHAIAPPSEDILFFQKDGSTP